MQNKTMVNMVEGCQFMKDLENQTNEQGAANLALYNLAVCVGQVKLFSKGIKPSKHWRLKDVKNYFGLSPFRSETKPSFSVAPDKNMWYDFGSGQGGNAVGFLIEYEKISFSEAVRSLAEKYNIEIIEVGDEQQSNLYDQLYEIHNLANLFFMNNLSSKKGLKAKKYLTERLFDDSIVQKFSIGYASDSWDQLYNCLLYTSPSPRDATLSRKAECA